MINLPRRQSYLPVCLGLTILIGGRGARCAEPTMPGDIFKRSQETRLVSIDADHYRLDEGSIICAPKVKTTIDTTLCQVTVKPHSAALICREVGLTRVIDLYDSRFGCIRVQCGDLDRGIGPGGEVSAIVAGSSAQAQTILLADNLRRRKVTVGRVPDSNFMIQDQVSMFDVVVVSKLPILEELHHSTDKEDKKMFDKIIKTTAALSLTESAQPYSVHE